MLCVVDMSAIHIYTMHVSRDKKKLFLPLINVYIRKDKDLFCTHTGQAELN